MKPSYLAAAVAVGFVLGVIVGWRAHQMRVGYLKNKRDFYSKKALETQALMESN